LGSVEAAESVDGRIEVGIDDAVAVHVARREEHRHRGLDLLGAQPVTVVELARGVEEQVDVGRRGDGAA
jgi:hypothetical protein